MRDFSRLKIQHFPARCLLFMNNNKDKSYSFWESTALTLSKFGVMILWIVFPWRPKVSLKYQFHTCLLDLSRVKFVLLRIKRLKLNVFCLNRIKALRKKNKYIKFLLFLVAFYNQKISEIHFSTLATQWSIFPDRRSQMTILYYRSSSWKRIITRCLVK